MTYIQGGFLLYLFIKATLHNENTNELNSRGSDYKHLIDTIIYK